MFYFSGTTPVLAWCVSRLISDHILRYACNVKGNTYLFLNQSSLRGFHTLSRETTLSKLFLFLSKRGLL